MIPDINFEMDEVTPLNTTVHHEHLDTSTSTMGDMMCVLMDTIMTMILTHDNLAMKHVLSVLVHQQFNVLNEITPCSIN